MIKLVPKKFYSAMVNYFNKARYIKNAQINMDVLINDIKQGRKDALDYFSSDLRKLVQKRNIKEAKKLGFKNHKPSQKELESINNAKYTTVYEPVESWAGRTDGTNTEINMITDNARAATFHESLHNGKLATTDSQLPGETFDQYRKRAKDTVDYFTYKTDNLIKPYDQIPENLREAYEYVEKPTEAAANIFELGYRLGLKPGSAYPGPKVVEQILQNAKGRKDIAYKANLLDILRPDRPKNVWDALTGQYYVTIPTVLLGGQQAIHYFDKERSNEQ